MRILAALSGVTRVTRARTAAQPFIDCKVKPTKPTKTTQPPRPTQHSGKSGVGLLPPNSVQVQILLSLDQEITKLALAIALAL